MKTLLMEKLPKTLEILSGVHLTLHLSALNKPVEWGLISQNLL